MSAAHRVRRRDLMHDEHSVSITLILLIIRLQINTYTRFVRRQIA